MVEQKSARNLSALCLEQAHSAPNCVAALWAAINAFLNMLSYQYFNIVKYVPC